MNKPAHGAQKREANMLRKLQNSEWMNLLQIAVGLFFCKVSYNAFLIPNNIAAGGFTGVGQLIHHATGFPVGVCAFLLNVPLFAFSMKKMGWRFGLRSFVTMILLSVVIDYAPFESVTSDMLLATVFGGICSGIGFGLVLRGSATTGGSDMLASLIHRFFPTVRVGQATFVIDALVIVASAFVFDAESAMYAVMAVFLSNTVVDLVLEGPNSSHAYFIISDKADAIAQRVMDELERGVTGLNGVGMYTMQEKRVLLCVVSRFEAMRLRRIVFSLDPAAFVVACKSHDTLGEGFKEEQA